MKKSFGWVVPAAAVILAAFAVLSLRGLIAQDVAGDATVAAAAKTAPAFSATDIAGKKFSLADYKGKVVLVDFWATWCPPCRAEMPNVVKTYKAHHARGFEIIGISLDRDKAALKSYLKPNGVTWRQVYDGDNQYAVSNKYNVEAIPTTYLIDGTTGKILAEDLRGEELAKAVNTALKTLGK